MADAAGTPEDAAVAASVGWFESGRYDRAVHVRATPYRDTGGYAISLWALHAWRLVPYREWIGLGGLDHTADAARVAVRVLAFTRNRCGHDRPDWREASIALYATGKRCSWKGAPQRAWVARKIQARIEAELSR